MESSPLTQNYSSGRLVLRTACHERPENMDRLADDNRFCHSCNKVVHNLVGKSEAEIKALFQANGGRLCGAIMGPAARPKPQIRYNQPLRKPSYLKHLAATASLLLLYQGMMAAPVQKQSQEWCLPADLAPDSALSHVVDPDWSKNTLVSGVVINQDSQEVGLDFVVLVYANKSLVRRVTAHNGFLKIDLQGKVSPETNIQLVIVKNTATYAGDEDSDILHGGLSRIVRLRDAQNLQLQVQYNFPQRYLGDMGWEENWFDDNTSPVDVQTPPAPKSATL